MRAAHLTTALWNPYIYEEGTTILQTAIQEYDQAVIDLTVSIVGGKLIIL